MADLSSLMRIAPISGAMKVGRQFDMEQASELMRQKELEQIIQSRVQDTEHKSRMNPLLEEMQRLNNQGASADLPGRHASSLIRGYEAARKGSSLPNDIAADEEASQTTRIKNQSAQRDEIGKLIGTWGATLQNVEPVSRKAHLASLMENSGIPKQILQPFLAAFEGVPQEKLPDALIGTSQKFMQMNPKYQQAMDVADRQVAGRLGAAETAGEYGLLRQESANAAAADRARINAGKRASSDDMLRKIKNPYDLYSALVDEATKAEQRGDKKTAMEYEARAEAIYPQAKEALKARVAGKIDMGGATGGKVNNVEPDDFRPPKGGTQQKPQINSVADLQKMYPGVPAAKLKELYKKKFGVDLK
jgi:hypothetical protein